MLLQVVDAIALMYHQIFWNYIWKKNMAISKEKILFDQDFLSWWSGKLVFLSASLLSRIQYMNSADDIEAALRCSTLISNISTGKC